MLADSDHLRCQDASGTVQRGEGLVELGHLPSNGRLPLHQVDFLAGITYLQRGLNTGDPCPNDHGAGIHWHLPYVQGFLKHHALHCGGDQPLGLLRGILSVGRDPGALLANVRHLKQELVKARIGAGATERRFMHQRRARGNDYSGQSQLLYVLLYHLLSRIRAHVLVVARHGYALAATSKLNDLRDVHRLGDVCSAVTDVDSDLFRHLLPPQ